jgi:putative membrane protein
MQDMLAASSSWEGGRMALGLLRWFCKVHSTKVYEGPMDFWPTIVVRACHFVAIMVWYGALLAAHLGTRKELRVVDVRRLRIVDRVGLVAGLAVFLVGLLLWFWVGKPAQFYTSNGLFHGKVTIFIVVYALGIAGPSLYWGAFLKAHHGSEGFHPVASWLKPLQGVQLLLLLLLPFLASMIAYGVGAKPVQ